MKEARTAHKKKHEIVMIKKLVNKKPNNIMKITEKDYEIN